MTNMAGSYRVAWAKQNLVPMRSGVQVAALAGFRRG
jgi:hypothetical protein